MFDEEAAKQNVEKKLSGYKQWKDAHGIEWIEMNGKKMLKRALVRVCMDMERKEAMEKNYGFLSF